MSDARVGTVTHWFSKLRVATVRLEAPVALGDRLQIRGRGKALKVKVKSLQINRQPIERAEAGQEVGILVGKKAHEGDEVLRLPVQRGFWSRLLGS